MLFFPSFFLILTVVAILPASVYNIMIVIGLTSWMGTTRFVRAEFLSPALITKQNCDSSFIFKRRGRDLF